MMYDYVIEKPELNEDTLAHYGIKGMKWKNHLVKHLVNAKGRIKSALGLNIPGLYRKGDSDPHRIAMENMGYQSTRDYARHIVNSFGPAKGKLQPRQMNRGYTNSGSAAARLSAKNSKVKTTKVILPITRPRSRKKTVRAGVGNIRKRIIG